MKANSNKVCKIRSCSLVLADVDQRSMFAPILHHACGSRHLLFVDNMSYVQQCRGPIRTNKVRVGNLVLIRFNRWTSNSNVVVPLIRPREVVATDRPDRRSERR